MTSARVGKASRFGGTRTVPDTQLLVWAETRGSDGLDFHDLAVWQIKQALQAAYEAGRASAK